jgi:ABC-type multidrug transport system ATPase subunit
MASEAAVEVHGLRKSYGSNEAVRGIDFEVERGRVFGFPGPNGAGQTTTIEILEGYLWGLVGIRIATTRFRWEPQGSWAG